MLCFFHNADHIKCVPGYTWLSIPNTKVMSVSINRHFFGRFCPCEFRCMLSSILLWNIICERWRKYLDRRVPSAAHCRNLSLFLTIDGLVLRCMQCKATTEQEQLFIESECVWALTKYLRSAGPWPFDACRFVAGWKYQTAGLAAAWVIRLK